MPLLYHASPVPGLHTLEPRVSNHGIPQVYFSRKRENVLVYPVQRHREVRKGDKFPLHRPLAKMGARMGFRRTAGYGWKNTTPMPQKIPIKGFRPISTA